MLDLHLAGNQQNEHFEKNRRRFPHNAGNRLLSALIENALHRLQRRGVQPTAGAGVAGARCTPSHAVGNAQLVARLERLPVTPRLMLLRVIVGIATFFDAYTVLAIAFAMPQLVSEWKLTPTEVGMIISAGYVGQLFGAVLFGSLAEKIGRLKTLFITIVLFVSMDIACLFAWSGVSMMALRAPTSMSSSAPRSAAASFCSMR